MLASSNSHPIYLGLVLYNGDGETLLAEPAAVPLFHLFVPVTPYIGSVVLPDRLDSEWMPPLNNNYEHAASID